MTTGSAVTRLEDDSSTITLIFSDDATVKAANVRRVNFSPTLKNMDSLTDFNDVLSMLAELFRAVGSDRRGRARAIIFLSEDVAERSIYDTNVYVQLGAPVDFDFGAIDSLLRSLSYPEASTLGEMMNEDVRFSLGGVILEPHGGQRSVSDLTSDVSRRGVDFGSEPFDGSTCTGRTVASTTDEEQESNTWDSVDAIVSRSATDDEAEEHEYDDF